MKRRPARVALMTAAAVAGGAAGALVVAGCTQRPAGGGSALETTFDFRAAQDSGAVVAGGLSQDFPGGWPFTAFLRPAGPGAEPDLASEAVVRLAFLEGKPAAYITTELWVDYPAVWLQPMYVLVTRWAEADPRAWWLPGAHPIFPVGPGSRFYSPFWQVIYAVVPETTPPDRYRSSAQLLADRLELHPGPGRLVALVPDDVGLEPAASSMPGLLGHPVGAPARGWGWVDGREARVRTLDFGDDRFEVDQRRREVTETPLYVFTARQSDGSYAPTGAPNVGGTRPPFSPRSPPRPRGRPMFGSLWRLYTVRLPPGDPEIGLFLPATARFEGLRQEVAGSVRGVAIPPVTWEFADPAQARHHLLKIALDGATCFKDEASLARCRWLDSQAAIEEHLPEGISRSDVSVACPLVTFEGTEIPPP